ncbi:MAG: 2-oxo acid dehydrogenase subunit E2 [Desulfosarcinaceae bacterium]|nr:2-oxo acid dehydrogenase subunit E2 [Desulfosarcinaceae bacterium]
MLVDVKIPEISENVTSGVVVAIHVSVGDTVKVDDVLIELETDKAVVEIPSTVAGVIKELLVADGDEKQVGAVIARIDTAASAEAAAAPAADSGAAAAPDETPAAAESAQVAAAPAPAAPAATPPTTAQPPVAPETAPAGDDAAGSAEAVTTAKGAASAEAPALAEVPAPDAAAPSAPAAPSVRRLARELGVDLSRVTATGPSGHLTAADVKAHARGGQPAATTAAGAGLQPPMPDATAFGPVEQLPLAGIRKITAANMATAWQTVPHVTQFDEADVTEVERYLRRKAAQVAKAGGKLTLTAVLIKVIAAALRRYPYFNASIDTAGGQVLLKKYVHIGVAVATEHGLMVPVVRDADRKSITEIAVEVVELAGKARRRKIQPKEMEGGSFTISNQGGIGGTAFTPIVNWPQVAILGVSRTALRQRPSDAEGHFVARRILPLALSYDHRLIDGADAAAFLHWVCETLAAPLNLVLESE